MKVTKWTSLCGCCFDIAYPGGVIQNCHTRCADHKDGDDLTAFEAAKIKSAEIAAEIHGEEADGNGI